MKNFNKFLEEVSIKGNPGVPGEGENKDGDKEYLSDVEKRAKDRLGITRRDHPRQYGPRLMQLVGQSQRLTAGKEEELEKLAHDIIVSNFGDIIFDVKLDIKLVRSGQDVADFMEDEGGGEPEELPEFVNIKDNELIKRIHKAKLGNNIIQGESKNTKHILHSDEVKDGLKEIFGDDSYSIFSMWDEISKLADKMDWLIPIEIKSDMMEQAPEGMAGAVNVEWEPKEEKEESEDEDGNKEGSEEDFNTEEPDEMVPVIKARGIDFPMLLHETVKGIYELIASVSQPGLDASEEEIKKAQTVKLNVSSFMDEAEDFRTGPEIASDFRDFINENPDSSYSPNIRAFVFGKMMDESYMSPEEFLKLFRGILNKSDEARNKVDSIITEIVDELKKYDLGEVIGHDDVDDEFESPEIDTKEETEVVDYSELSQRNLQKLIDDALDDGDFDEVKKLSGYLTEGKEIYLKELEYIKEGYNLHTKK